MQEMRALRPAAALLLLPCLGLALAGCSSDSSTSLPTPSRAFCHAAYTYDDQAPELAGHINRQIELVQAMADHAPRDVKADAETFLHAMERRRDGDPSVVDNPKIQQAVENVNRRAANGCSLYKQDPASQGI